MIYFLYGIHIIVLVVKIYFFRYKKGYNSYNSLKKYIKDDIICTSENI